jgi:hypothetical protein
LAARGKGGGAGRRGTRLLEFLAELDSDEWDRQVEADAKNGKLDELAKQALEDVKAGRFREL